MQGQLSQLLADSIGPSRSACPPLIARNAYVTSVAEEGKGRSFCSYGLRELFKAVANYLVVILGGKAFSNAAP